MRKPTICLCENKDADQLCSNCTADQGICFHHTDGPYIKSFKLLALFCDCTAWFVRPGRKPKLLVLSCTGSNNKHCDLVTEAVLKILLQFQMVPTLMLENEFLTFWTPYKLELLYTCYIYKNFLVLPIFHKVKYETPDL